MRIPCRVIASPPQSGLHRPLPRGGIPAASCTVVLENGPDPCCHGRMGCCPHSGKARLDLSCSADIYRGYIYTGGSFPEDSWWQRVATLSRGGRGAPSVEQGGVRMQNMMSGSRNSGWRGARSVSHAAGGGCAWLSVLLLLR